MYSSLNEVVQDLQLEGSFTQKVLDVLTDRSLSQPIAEGYRTLGDLAWHLSTAFNAILGAAGLEIKGPDGKDAAPASAKAIADAYRAANEAAIAAVQSQWTDATLKERRNMWGMMDLSIPEVVTMFIRHQAHHRGQLTVLMRQAGLTVPGVYGPSKEEWEAMSGGH